jgi:hypothetical protein
MPTEIPLLGLVLLGSTVYLGHAEQVARANACAWWPTTRRGASGRTTEVTDRYRAPEHPPTSRSAPLGDADRSRQVVEITSRPASASSGQAGPIGVTSRISGTS